MLTILPFHAGDKALAARLAEWILELGGVKAHDCLLAVHKDTDSSGVIEPLTEAFGRVAEFTINDDMIVEREQHAYAANLMWKRTVNHVADMNESQPWLWMEMDSTPVPPKDKKKSWLDYIAAGYQEGGKPFMHCLVQTARGKSNSGCGVYPAKVRDYTDRLWELSNISWDVLFFDDFSRHTAYTPFIQDVGFLADGATLPTFPDNESLSLLRPATALFHRCKDGTLIDRLREERNGVCVRGLSVSAPRVGQERSAGESITPALPPEGSNPSAPILRETELLDRISRLESLLTKLVPAEPEQKQNGQKQKPPSKISHSERMKEVWAKRKAKAAKAAERKKKLTGVL